MWLTLREFPKNLREYKTRKVISRAQVKSKGADFYHDWNAIMLDKEG